jgi:hypothetical protein
MKTDNDIEVQFSPVWLTAARNLCAGSLAHNPEYVRGVAEVLIDLSYGASQNEWKDALMRWLDGQTLVDPNAPLSDDQRRALFAAFRDVFPNSTGEHARYVFTRVVLGKEAGTTVSWSSHKPGALTHGEASRVLDALSDLGAVL